VPPKVSICVPNLNKAPYVAELLDSLVNQTLQDWEMIISDNYSDDGSYEIFQQYAAKDKRIKLSQAPRRGMYQNWNECLRRASGELIYIATSDDAAEPNLLEELLRPMTKRPDIDIAVCDFYRIDEHGKRLPRGRRTSDVLGEWVGVPSVRSGRTEFIFHMCCCSIWSTMNSVMFRRSLLDRVGLFSTSYGSAGDYDWTLRASLETDIAWVPKELAIFRYHDGQATPKAPSVSTGRRTKRIYEELLRDKTVGIPPDWSRVPKWQDRLLTSARLRYLRALELERRNVLRQPGKFLRNSLEAAVEEPRWFVGWLRHGCRYTAADWIKDRQYAYELIKLFQAPWPPERVEGEW
jgi:glycosyltransferase involved in cell wall biosynthesis